MAIGKTNEPENRDEFVTMKNLIDRRVDMVPIKKVYSKRTHITVDNHFLGENVM